MNTIKETKNERGNKMKGSYSWEDGIIEKIHPAKYGHGATIRSLLDNKVWGVGCFILDQSLKVGDKCRIFIEFNRRCTLVEKIS